MGKRTLFLPTIVMSSVLALFLQGCSAKYEAAPGSAGAVGEVAYSQAPGKPAVATDQQTRGKYLAYEHHVTVDAAESDIKPLLDKLVAACNADMANQCTLLASGVEGGRVSSASIRVRVKRPGIEKLIALAATGGEVASRNTSAEDLEGPIRDNAKRLDMLRSYREKLLALENKVGNNAEALIKLSQELATVQSELESAAGVEARLMERVNMDLLNISIQSRTQRGFWSPVKRATSDFGSNLSEGIASAITGLAYLLPWSLTLFLAGFVVRKLWRRMRRK